MTVCYEGYLIHLSFDTYVPMEGEKYSTQSCQNKMIFVD